MKHVFCGTILGLISLLLIVGCSGSKSGMDIKEPTEGPVLFREVTKEAKLDFQHFDSATPLHTILETMGSGIGWIDFDNDGYVDLFCVQVQPIQPKVGESKPTSKLYRNNGDGTFADVTAALGLDQSGYGMGVAVGDFDNDGFDDLFVTYFGEVRLYRNEAGKRFQDITAKAGLTNLSWATSCALGDIDNDGFLDFYVCNYVDVDLAKYKPCIHAITNEPYTCHPRVFPSAKHRLFRNRGNGTFEDISVSSGIGALPAAPGLAVVLADIDDDGLLDIYAVNDMMAAYLFHNQGKGKFKEIGVKAGCALQDTGRYMAGMGIAVGDVDGSGRASLFVTNYQSEPNNLFLNQGNRLFQDATHASGLGPPSMPFLAFGCWMFDADGDGHLDIAVANGHVQRDAPRIDTGTYAQTAQLFHGLGRGRFRDISKTSGSYFHRPLVGRGVAVADYDNDTKPDLVYSHNGGPLVLLKNESPGANRWLRLDLVGDGKKSNRNAIGAQVVVEVAGAKQTHWIIGGGSYLSASDRRLCIGVGTAEAVERVEVRWPSGKKQEWKNLATAKGHALREE
jgi:hypothetical protein